MKINGLRNLFLKSCLLFFIFSCEKSTNNPPPPPAGPDTTSHNFTWQIDTIGPLSSSLSDVFAISENDIWAVGHIQFTDSLGNYNAYNAVHWDGNQWEMKQINSNHNTIISHIRGIWAFSDDDIWLAAGSIYHWNGNVAPISYQRSINTSETVEELWYNQQMDIFGAGNEGLIVKYDGTNWNKLESGTTISLRDIWGKPNTTNVWTCGYASNNSESILLRYDGSQWQTVWRWHFQTGVSDSNYVGLLSSLWAFDSDSLIIVSGDGVFRQDILGSAPPRKEKLNLDAFPFRVRGSAPNNIFICGDNGRIWHYNGATWKGYPELHNPNWVWRSIAVLENKEVAVGEDYSQGIQRYIILTGIRS